MLSRVWIASENIGYASLDQLGRCQENALRGIQPETVQKAYKGL